MTTSLFHADCLRVREYIEDESVDAIVTDPPYGLGFMGHGWDHEVPGPEYWREFLHVAKPGANLVACGGTRTWHRLACAIEDAGWEIYDSLAWLYSQGYPKAKTLLKPAHEPIVMARKPGPAYLNLDACRIPAERKGRHSKRTARDHDRASTAALSMRAGDPCDGKGRWPANVLLDEACAGLLDEQSGVLRSGYSAGFIGRIERSVALSDKRAMIRPESVYADEGGASRFYYVAKASKSERTHDGAVENTHPTVKPIALMEWLAVLVTPPGGCIMDPFMGSGTAAVACEKQGFDFIGFEKDMASFETAEARASQVA